MEEEGVKAAPTEVLYGYCQSPVGTYYGVPSVVTFWAAQMAVPPAKKDMRQKVCVPRAGYIAGH